MVEATGPRTQLPGTEETKGAPSNELTYVVGNQAAWGQDIKDRLEGVDMNALESGLLDRYIQDPATCQKNVLSLCQKLELKAEAADDKYSLKRLRKLIPLLMEHDFWSTQPVPKYFERFHENLLNKPIETKTVAEVRQQPYDLP